MIKRIIKINYLGLLAIILIDSMFLRALFLIKFEFLEPIDFVNMGGFLYFSFYLIKAIFFPFIICFDDKIIINKFFKKIIYLDSIESIKVQGGFLGKMVLNLKEGNKVTIDTVQLNRLDVNYIIDFISKSK
jgi:hypothetical protein